MSTPESQTQRTEPEDEYERELREIEEEEALEEQKRVEEERRRKEESERRARERREALLKKKAEAEAEKRRKAEEEARKKAEEEARRAEEAQREAEEARRRAEEVQRAQQGNEEDVGAPGTSKRKLVAEVVVPRPAKRTKKAGEPLTIRLPVPGPSNQVETVGESDEEEEVEVMETRSRKRRGNYDVDGAKVKMGGDNRCSRCMIGGKECLPSEGEKIFSCARCATSKHRCTLGTEADLPEGERQMLLINEVRRLAGVMETLATEQRRANRSMVAKQKRIEKSSAGLREDFGKLVRKLVEAGVVRADSASNEKDTGEEMEE